MDLGEHTLLSRPALMLTVLRAASRGAVTLDDCLRLLRENLARANETEPPVDARDLLTYMDEVKRYLLAAGLLTTEEEERFTATERGRDVLAEHPAGVDESVLMQFPEFREFIRRSVQRPAPEDPSSAKYEEGYDAHEAGASLVDNPYPPDTIEHLVWENGWFEARDEQTEHEGVR